MAHKHHIKVLLNPAPATKLPDELLSMVEMITPNESECEIITGQAIKSIADAKNAVQYLRDKGILEVVVTLGKNGVVCNIGAATVHRPVPEVEVVDTTAAGDCFTAALAVASSNGSCFSEAVDFANLAASLTVTQRGAQSALPSIKEVRKFMDSKRLGV